MKNQKSVQKNITGQCKDFDVRISVGDLVACRPAADDLAVHILQVT